MINITKEFLLKEYKEKQRSKADIARELGCSVTTLDKKLKKFGIVYNKIKSFHLDNLVNQKFGRWTVIEKAESKGNNTRWLCVCDCNTKKIVAASSLKRGVSTSCGCIKRELYSTGYKDISGAFWRKLHKSAIERNWQFNITIEYAWDLWIKQNGKCALSGMNLSLTTNNDVAYKQTASIDRINSSNGYEKGNVQWVHKIVNIMKMNLDEDMFVFWCQQIAKNHETIELKPIFLYSYHKPKRLHYENY